MSAPGGRLTFDEVCWACQQVARFYPEPVPMSVLAEVAGMDIGLCDRHWSWWLAYWMSSEFSPGCASHLIGVDTDREFRCICADPLSEGEAPRPCPEHGWMGEGDGSRG